MLVSIVWWFSAAIFIYFVIYTLVTFALIGLSLYETALVKVERGEIFKPPFRRRRPAISLIAPAYNMEPIIVDCVRSFLAVDYDPLEVILVDDGSEDGTADALIKAFDMVPIPVGDRFPILTEPITAAWVSRSDHRLRVVRKENGGRADAINAGLNVAYTELVALTDADTLVEADALKRVGEVFASDPDDVVAVGGTVRILNGVMLDGNAIGRPHVAGPGIQASQTCEYLRGFFGGRIAWSAMNGLMILSGAFGVFRLDVIRKCGGLSRDTLGEDMEMTLHVHHQLRPQRPNMRVAYAPDANVWTEIPTSLKPLRGQRVRWHVGLLDNMRIHRKMVCRRRFGAVGWGSLPYTILFEVAGPILQVGGYVILVFLLFWDAINWPYAVALFVITWLVGQTQTAGAILIEELGFRRYVVRDLMRLAFWGMLELFWFRPITAVWRVWATGLYLVGKRPGWGSIPRGAAFQEDQGAEIAPTPLPR